MSKFGGSNSKKDVPGISSGSLSDIVFMLLFFFMVTTQMRETEGRTSPRTSTSAPRPASIRASTVPTPVSS